MEKLTPAQAKVISLMQLGYGLQTFGTWDGANSQKWVNYVHLWKDGKVDRLDSVQNRKKSSMNTVKALEKKGLITPNWRKHSGNGMLWYKLTKKGKETV